MLTKQQQKWIPAIMKLIQLTQKQKLKWKTELPPDTLQKRKIDLVYSTQFKDSKLRLYRLNDKYERLGYISYFDLFRPPKSEPASGVVLELVDSEEDSVSEISKIEGLDDLLKAVKSQTTAFVDSFLDELMKAE